MAVSPFAFAASTSASFIAASTSSGWSNSTSCIAFPRERRSMW